MTLEKIGENRCFDGLQQRYQHHSQALDCDMVFSVFLPPQAADGPVPLIYWLSGLTCTDQNFVQKAGAQRYAAERGVAIVAPDTSPRGDNVPDDPEQSWDFGSGAGFYLNATQAPYAAHYHMYDYVVTELPEVLKQDFPLDLTRGAIMGHSMGGHGAISIGLKNPEKYRSVSAFSPISNPSTCPWGHKAFGNYLGNDRERWKEYDSCELLFSGKTHPQPLLVDQGANDEFLVEQLKPHALSEACAASGQTLELRMREGYDHSYFFIASFIGEHIRFHADNLA